MFDVSADFIFDIDDVRTANGAGTLAPSWMGAMILFIVYYKQSV